MGATSFEMENMRAMADPSLRVRFSLSFAGQMMLSGDEVKEYCAAAANAILSYEDTRYRTTWTGVYFTAGGRRIAALAFYEDTLCLFLAEKAENVSGARYKAQDMSSVRRFEKTPAMLPLKSEGAVKNAVKRLRELAAGLSLTEKAAPAAVFSRELFPREEFETLLQRGLIRPTGKYGADAEGEFAEVLAALSAGEAAIRFSEKKMLRALDEGWVEQIEKCLPAIDELLRRPSHFIAETEEIRPMELTRKITGRSVAHLCQHTDFIASVKGDEVTPSKMLNIIREDSILTYENKFLNTLLANLYFFVSERYRIALENGVDERISSVRFSDSFYQGDTKALVTINIQRSEKVADARGVQKSYFSSKLWKRVERLNEITRAYMESDFVREMGRSYVKPPILRTNAILKNKYFRQCLDLWTFLQSYDESGCGLTVEETLLQPDQKYMGDLFGAAAAQYLLFCRNAGDGTERDVLHTATAPTVHPRLNILVEDEADAVAEIPDLTVKAPNQPPQERDIGFALRVALKAAAFYDEQQATGETVRLEKDLEARLRLADQQTKERFAAIADALSGYSNVKKIQRRTNFAFYQGKTVLARLTVRGSEVLLYTALAPEKLPKSYGVQDVSGVKRYAVTPSLLCVKTDRQMAAALKLAERLEKSYSLEKSGPVRAMDPEDYGMLPFEELLARGVVRRAETPNRSETAERSGRKEPVQPVQPAVERPHREEIPPIVQQEEPEGEEIILGVREEPIMPELAGEASGADKEPTAEAEYFQAAATLDEAQEIMAEEAAAEAADNGHSLPSMQYPAAMDYSRPAQKGVDDVGSFLEDSRTNEDREPESAQKPAPRTGLLQRLLRRKKGDKGKAE